MAVKRGAEQSILEGNNVLGEKKRIKASSVEPARTQNACIACRDRKVKCSGDQPCRYCSKRRLECVFGDIGRRKMYSIAYVEELERRASAGTTNATDGPSSPLEEINTITSPQENNIKQYTNPRTKSGSLQINDMTESDRRQLTPQSAMVIDPSLSSSVKFGTSIKALPLENTSSGLTPSNNSMSQLVDSPEDAYKLSIQDGRKRTAPMIHSWPTEEEAQALLDTVLDSIGRIQHLFDPRQFSDNLAMAYENEIVSIDIDNLWYVEMLLVFAIGKLLQGKLEEGVDLPGRSYFTAAIQLLPDLCTLRSAGTLAIEVLGLVAFYLQCSDRRDDAYVYAGTAMRLAISNGMARERCEGYLNRTAKSHRNRLWWTIYMQERRLGIAVGHPLTLNDDSIRVSLPSESPGFLSPKALNVNIRIAQISGRIVHDLYGQRIMSEGDFISNVQEILTSLVEAGEKMPVEYSIDFSKPLNLSRTSGTIYLMLHQAMILATRPVLLHLAKTSFASGRENVNSNFSTPKSSLRNLAGTCIQAATRSLTILQALQKQSLLASFGFFDLDATFSVAFIFLLAGRINAGGTKAGKVGLEGAIRILDHLILHGNKPASARKDDIAQMCNHLSVRFPGESFTNSSIQHFDGIRFPSAVEEPNEGMTSTQHGEHIADETLRDGSLEEGWQGDHTSQLLLDFPNAFQEWAAISDMSEWQDSHDVFTLYHDEHLMLTGALETDWEELERHIDRYVH